VSGTTGKIARVVMDLSLDKEFDYLIPANLVKVIDIGHRVVVPFKFSPERFAYVVALVDWSAYPKLRSIKRLADKSEQIPENLIRLARWIADYYCCPFEKAVQAMLPAVVRGGTVGKKMANFAILNTDFDFEKSFREKRTSKKRKDIVQYLREHGATAVTKLSSKLSVSVGLINGLKHENWLFIEKQEIARDPFVNDIIIKTNSKILTSEQADALEVVCTDMLAKKPGVILLHGVTGSGKTEVYMQAIQYCLDAGKDAIVLVPEIALTPQTNERFRSRFGENVSVMHSGLSAGERFDEWRRVNENRAKIVVGARSALFAPFKNLGLIVIDEEHENSYKQNESPRYHARDIAVIRGKFEGATVILGSATPALESYKNAMDGKYKLVEMLQRIDNQVMPTMELVDMRRERQGGGGIFSRRLVELIHDRLDKHEQVILFLNRRGFASQMMCTMCGYVASCSDCSLTFTYHRDKEYLTCHLCGKGMIAPKCCPQCQDENIRYTGLGTEKVEDVVRKLFPYASIERMDSDTMTTKNSYKRVLDKFRSHKIDILIGTQMIAKGLHFPDVTLVGVVFADLGLHIPDFRAGERVFQLLIQVAGRAGRGEVPGRVVVQTYTPYHDSLTFAYEYNYKGFFKDEMEGRSILKFPPATHMAMVHFRSIDEKRVEEGAMIFAKELKKHIAKGMKIAGPMPSPISKIKKYFRYQLSVRGGNTRHMLHILRHLSLQWWNVKGVSVYVDVDPYSLM